ncbi:MAG: LamG domain-containing protein [Flavobacterium sp.]|nr:LamG domain-containing protein [Flavobacterium sp.]
MKINSIVLSKVSVFIATTFLLVGCQNMDEPALGDYPTDEANIPAGDLRFFVPFDKEADLIRFKFAEDLSGYPCFTPDNSVSQEEGVNSGAFKSGASGSFLKYLNANDFATVAESFTVSLWEKRDGQTKNNTGANGPEYPFSFTAKNGYHWSGSNFFLLLEGDNSGCAVKVVVATGDNGSGAASADTWLTWEGAASIPGLLDNEWHHLVFVYDATTSGLTFYKDGVAIGTKTWGSHGPINFMNSAVTSFRIGCGPGSSFTTGDWLSSSWKGSLDQFRLYATALSASEVQDLYTNNN